MILGARVMDMADISSYFMHLRFCSATALQSIGISIFG